MVPKNGFARSVHCTHEKQNDSFISIKIDKNLLNRYICLHLRIKFHQ